MCQQQQGCSCNDDRGACRVSFQYAVKLVCGDLVIGPTASNLPLAPGRYRTAVNVHNPSKCRVAQVVWKVALALEGREGPISRYRTLAVLNPDGAIEIDCGLINTAVPSPPPPFQKGWVVLESDCELDVVSVYTSAANATSPATAFHTERVAARCVPQCDKLVLPLHTGIAAWQTTQPGPAAPVAIVVPQASGWTSAPAGSAWVSHSATDGSSAPLGTYVYQLCFQLCSGFVPPPQPIVLSCLSDGPGQIRLNGSAPVAIAGWTSPTTVTFPSSLLRAGRNCFTVTVQNSGDKPNPTGFAVAGILQVDGGKCPCSDAWQPTRSAEIADVLANDDDPQSHTD